MTTAFSWLYRQVAAGLVLLFVTPFGMGSASAQQETPPSPQVANASAGQVQPLKTDGRSNNALMDAPSPHNALHDSTVAPSDADAEAQDATAAQNAPQQNPPAQPLGTAAAPSQPDTGVAASRPSGAAIAPGRQKRARSLVIKVGLLIGAAVAVGTVVALSSASSSRP
jgi:cytoskeletal protein RodZ